MWLGWCTECLHPGNIRVLALYTARAGHDQRRQAGGSSMVSTVLVNKANLDNADIKCWLMRIKLTHLAASEAAQVTVDGSCVSLEFMDVQHCL